MAKRGLKIRDVAKDHFSSGIVQSEPHFSRLVIRFLEGKDLLASDIETGKSDPVSFVWCGPINDAPILDEADLPESGILRTSVCPTTINPIWNEDVIFPLDITDIKSFTEMKCLVYVRDEDLGAGEGGMTTYDELGMLELPFKDIYTKGKAFKNSIVISGTWYTLAKSPGMRRVDGQIKLTISLIFAPEDNEVIMKQLPSAAESSNFSRSSIHQLNSVSQKVQRFLTNPAAMEAEVSKVDPRLRLSMSSLGRPSSATSKSSSRSTFSIASIAPMVRRPSTAPQKRPDEAQLLAAVREKKENSKPRRRSAGDENGSVSASENDNEEGNDDENGEEEDGEDLDEILEEEEEDEKEEPNSDDELIVMKPSAVAKNKNTPKPNKRYDKKSESQGDSSNNIGVDVGGYDLSELLPTDKDSKQAMEDIITVGVNQITASLDSGLFKSHAAEGSKEQKDQAVEVAKKIKSTAAEMAKDPPVAKQPLQPSPVDPEQPLSEEELLSGRAPPGDEGVLEEVVNLAVRGVANALQSADVEYMGTLKETGKLVAKTAKNVAGEAGQAVKSIAGKAVQELNGIDATPLVKGAAVAAKQQLHHLVANPVETLVSGGAGTALALASDEEVPLADKKLLKKVKTPTNAASKQSAQQQQQGSNKESYAHPRLAGSDSDQGPLLDPSLMMLGAGDFAVNPENGEEENDEAPELTNSPQQRKTRPISAPSTHSANKSNTLTPNSGAMVAYEGGPSGALSQEAQLQLQAELKQQAQGHATAVVRALKEMSSQRKVMEKSLEKIATATAAGFSKLSERISHLEDALLMQHHLQGGDQELPPEEEELDEYERSNPPSRSASRTRLHNTTPARLEGKGQQANSQPGRAGSVPRGGRSNTSKESNNNTNNNTNKKESTGTTGGNGRSKGATSSTPPRRPASAAPTKKDTYGNVGAIAAAKAQARANKRKLAHAPYASFEDSLASSGNSSSNFHFQPSAQILFRGADGRVESSTLAAPPATEQPNALQYQQQQQQQQQQGQGQERQMQQGNSHSPGRPYSSNGFMNPNNNDNNNNYSNGYNNNGYNNGYNNQESPYNNNNNNNQNSNLTSYYPTPNSNPYNPALQNSMNSNNNNYNNNALVHPAQSGGVKYPLNKEFSGVLERGSLEDIARLLESTAPRPEDLSASVRNRLYDAVATLLHQNSHTERCLMWVLALLRGPSALLNEVVGHTVRDLREALETVALEASKRGLLASLLKSQIHR